MDFFTILSELGAQIFRGNEGAGNVKFSHVYHSSFPQVQFDLLFGWLNFT